jgi:hypothetical protein
MSSDERAKKDRPQIVEASPIHLNDRGRSKGNIPAGPSGANSERAGIHDPVDRAPETQTQSGLVTLCYKHVTKGKVPDSRLERISASL